MTAKEILLQASLDLRNAAMMIPNEENKGIHEFNLRVIEDRTIRAAMSYFKHKDAAASALGICRSSLDFKLKRMENENRN